MFPRASTLARFTATLLAVLWACQPVALLAHGKEHSHRFCPQHQAFEESPSGVGSTLSRLAGQRAPEVSAIPEVSDTARPAHETCPLLNAGTRDATPTVLVASTVSRCLAVSRPATAPPQAFPPLSVLATAPKASPPARA